MFMTFVIVIRAELSIRHFVVKQSPNESSQ